MGAALWALAARRASDTGVRDQSQQLTQTDRALHAARAAAEAFETAVIALGDGPARLVAGEESLAVCADRLGAAGGDAPAVLEALRRADPNHAPLIDALVQSGAPCAFEVRAASGGVAVEGRAIGALAFLRLSLLAADAGLPTAARLAAFIDARAAPAWIAAPDGSPSLRQPGWLEAAGAENLRGARDKGLTFDRAADDLAREAARTGERREAVRWAAAGGRRRAFHLTAQPLEGGGVGVWSEDVTEAEEAAESLRRNAEAQDQTLNQIREGVAIFGRDRRLQFNNAAFAALWGLEPAWLAERPSHGELLDRLRQRRRLPESADYSRWKAAELAAYEALAPAEDLWRLPDARTLRVVRQPHPWGGLLLLFSDLTDELKLKAEFNALIQVQQATLDKLTDAVAVFSSDGRLKLHNEAFERFWNVTAADLAAAADFEGVEDLCLRRLHDRQFWRDLKARVTDPEPKARAPISESWSPPTPASSPFSRARCPTARR
ncbi:MAG: PAS-domain containing protein [Caulobacteraceae bacterium]